MASAKSLMMETKQSSIRALSVITVFSSSILAAW
jgi:hypothetical protein